MQIINKMKKLLGIIVLGLLWCNVSYGALFYGKETLPVVSEPEGANCTLKNNKGSWEVKTPTVIELKLSKKDLEIVCKKDGYKTKTITISLKDKTDLSDGANDYVKVFDSNSKRGDFIWNSTVAAITKDPSDAIFLILDSGVNIIKGTSRFIKNTVTKTGEIFGSAKKKIKGDATYANAMVNSARLDSKIPKDVTKKLKGGYYSLIFIELEKN